MQHNSNLLKGVVLVFLGFAINIAAQNTLNLNIGQATYKINRAIYGALLENWGRNIYTGLYVGGNSSIPNTNGMRNDVIAAFKEAGVSCLEWPGGCYAETYRWANGIGPKANRPGGEQTNGLGTDEYFQLCQLAGTIPYITCNMWSAAASESAGWLNYCDSLYRGKLYYWKIGNESWGGCGNNTPISTYMPKYQQFVNAIPSKFSGQLFRIGQGSRDYETPANYWTDSMMRAQMPNFDGLSWHFYAVTSWSAMGPSYGFTEAQYYAQLQKANDINGLIQACETVMNKYDPNVTKGLMVDEWGAWYASIPGMGLSYTQSSVRDALIAGISLNIFNNHCRRVKMALVAQAVNVIQSLLLTKATTFASTDASMIKTPVFYVFKMYKVHQNATMVPATLVCGTNQSIPVLTASASIDSLNVLHISIGNTHATASQTLTVTLTGAPRQYTNVTGQIINGPAFNSINDYNVAENVNIQPFAASNFTLSGSTLTVTMPAHSVVTLSLTPGTTSANQGYNSQFLGNGLSGFVVKPLPDGSMALDYSTVRSIPVTLALYGVDGRTIVPPSTLTLEPGHKSIVWQPKGVRTEAGSGICVARVTVDGKMKTQRLLR